MSDEENNKKEIEVKLEDNPIEKEIEVPQNPIDALMEKAETEEKEKSLINLNLIINLFTKYLL